MKLKSHIDPHSYLLVESDWKHKKSPQQGSGFLPVAGVHTAPPSTQTVWETFLLPSAEHIKRARARYIIKKQKCVFISDNHKMIGIFNKLLILEILLSGALIYIIFLIYNLFFGNLIQQIIRKKSSQIHFYIFCCNWDFWFVILSNLSWGLKNL